MSRPPIDHRKSDAASAGTLAAALIVGAGLVGIVSRPASPSSWRQQEPEPTSAQRLMPDHDAGRRERLDFEGDRFRTPDGFVVEEVASNELVGSLVNLAFDPRGRPLVAREGEGLAVLADEDGDGRFERSIELGGGIRTAHGLYYLGPGDLLVHADGPRAGAGLYRLQDFNGDDRIDRVDLLMASRGGIQEHGPHTITRGPEGDLYLLYGNHAGPDTEPGPLSPLRELAEDQLLPVVLDPRGHANDIRAPGGTVWRVVRHHGESSGEFGGEWQRLVGGLRNPFDMAFDGRGELFLYEADMEWDRSLPWFRPTRVLHAVPAGDYGWRTGSGKISADALDTLPSVVDIGRGSPVGVVVYRHHVYPQRFHGALFLGDWSRGRIRVLFPQRDGATFRGEAVDFVLGEPLNVTDLDVGPDGLLYFSTGGRRTSGGLYRVTYAGEPPLEVPTAVTPIDRVLRQAMPRSAWGRAALERRRRDLGERQWVQGLRTAVEDPGRSSEHRQLALELLETEGPALAIAELQRLARSPDPEMRAAAARLLGTRPWGQVEAVLRRTLDDPDPLVVRRACEALVRAGLGAGEVVADRETLHALWTALDHDDRFVRYAAREALRRVVLDRWLEMVLADDPRQRPRGTLEGVLALVLRPQDRPASSEALALEAAVSRLLSFSELELADDTLLDFLRALELALIRWRPGPNELDGPELLALGERLLQRFPHGDPAIDRRLERLLAYLHPPGAIAALLDRLDTNAGYGASRQEEEIATVYALRAIGDGWSEGQRRRLVEWFDRGRTLRGAASMAGYIDHLFEDVLDILPDAERKVALERRDALLRERALQAAELMERATKKRDRSRGDDLPDLALPDLAQMSFDEVAEYLEYDIMTYERYSPEQGELVFRGAGCADCHVFGSIGRGGGPDLSTVVKRFRRREILESIVYPSRVISDQYTSVDVTLKNGEVRSGMVVGEGERRLTLISARGERIRVRKSRIVSQQPSAISIMPEGLLDAMDLVDLVNLIRFLDEAAEED